MFRWENVAVGAITAALVLCSLIGNSLVIVGTGMYNSLSVDRITMWFIQCLATIDVCTSCLCLSLFILHYFNSILGVVFESLFHGFLMIEAYAITVMVFHRFFSLVQPLRSLTLRKQNLWIAEVILGLTSFVLSFGKVFTPQTWRSVFEWIYMLLALIIPVFVLFIALVGIWVTLNRNYSRNKPQNCKSSFGKKIYLSIFGGLLQLDATGSKCVFKKGAALLFLVGVSFDITIIPMQIVLFLEMLDITNAKDNTSITNMNILIYVRWLYLLGISVNPFIYTAMSKKFRKFIVSVILCRARKTTPKHSSITMTASV